MAIEKCVADAIEEIDAALFSADTFVSKENRAELREMMARWERELKSFDEIFPDGAKDD